MPNSSDLNEQMEFDNRLKEMSVDERSLFLSRQIYTLVTKVDTLNVNFATLDTKFDGCIAFNGSSKRTSAISGGVTGGIIAAIIAIIEYFKGH